MRLGAFGVIGTQIHVGETPLEAVGNLRAQTIDLVVVAVDAHDARAIDGGVEDFGRFEVGGNEHASVEALLSGLRGDGIGGGAGGAAAHGLGNGTGGGGGGGWRDRGL